MNEGLFQRFAGYVQMDETGCARWSASKFRGGYGRITIAGKSRLAHRVSYEMFVGPIPEGLCLDHLCRNRDCVNPEHLEPVTQKENVRRGDRVKTHCPTGHEYSGDNLYLWRGIKYCRSCTNRRSLEYKRKKLANG